MTYPVRARVNTSPRYIKPYSLPSSERLFGGLCAIHLLQSSLLPLGKIFVTRVKSPVLAVKMSVSAMDSSLPSLQR